MPPSKYIPRTAYIPAAVFEFFRYVIVLLVIVFVPATTLKPVSLRPDAPVAPEEVTFWMVLLLAVTFVPAPSK